MAEIIRIPGPGEVIDGQFTLQREIGRGGYGVVYEAIQRGVERQVALKMLLPKALEEQSGVVDRFSREARLASSLAHPSAVTIYAFGVYEAEDEEAVGLPYIAMEYLRGESLQDYLVRRGPLSPDETRDIIQEVLGSLAEAHRKGIIHRDIKPDNIFLHRPEGEAQVIKVLDFGISLAISPDWSDEDTQRLTETGLVTGTAEYMAPEQVMGNPRFTAAVDIYAIGCVCYHLLTGRFPFQGQTPVEIAIRHVYDPIPPLPEEVQNTLFGQIIERSLHKDPRVRFADAGAMLNALTSGELPPLPVDAETLVHGPAPAGTGVAPAPGAPMISGPLPPPTGQQRGSGLTPAASAAPSHQMVIPAPAPSSPDIQTPSSTSSPERDDTFSTAALLGVAAAALLVIALAGVAMVQMSATDAPSGAAAPSPPVTRDSAPPQQEIVDEQTPPAPDSADPSAAPQESSTDAVEGSTAQNKGAPAQDTVADEEDRAEGGDAAQETVKKSARPRPAATRQARRDKQGGRTTTDAKDTDSKAPAGADEAKAASAPRGAEEPTSATQPLAQEPINTATAEAPAAAPSKDGDGDKAQRAGDDAAKSSDEPAPPPAKETAKADEATPAAPARDAPPTQKQTTTEKKEQPVFDGF